MELAFLATPKQGVDICAGIPHNMFKPERAPLLTQMKLFTALAALALIAAPVQAQSVESIVAKFCKGAEIMNENGISAAPGSSVAKQIVGSGDNELYLKLWSVSTRTYCPYIF